MRPLPPSTSRLFVLAIALAFGLASGAQADTATFSRDSHDAAAHPRAIAVADFDHDGLADIATAGTNSPSVTILYNDRFGSFGRSFSAVVGGGPFDMTAADLNRDGYPDLAIANADSNAVTIILGSSSGPQSVNDIPLAGNPRGIAVADATGDGIPDILVTQYAANTWTLLVGNGRGGVASRVTYPTASRPQGIAAADLNHDGRMDAVVANAGATSVSAFYGIGATTATRRDTATGAHMNVLTTGDFNRDGWLDVVAASSDSSVAVVLRGTSTGLTKIATLAAAGSPRGVIAADVNEDGALDVALASRNSNVITVYSGRGDGTFGDAVTLAGGLGSRAIAAADFNRDGRVDLVSANENDSSTTLFLNTTALTEAAHVFSIRDYGDVGNGSEMEGQARTAIADFDHDGRVDFAIPGGAAGTHVFLADGRQVDIGTGFPWQLAVGDFNNDGNPDLLATSNGNDEVSVILGDGHGGFTVRSVTVTLPLDIVVGDFNRDGFDDFVVEARHPSGSGGSLHLFTGRGDGSFDSATIIPVPYQAIALVAGDLNGDGSLDIVTSMAYPSPPELRVFFGDGQGGWPGYAAIPLSRSAGSLAIANVTEGGWPDIVAGTSDAIVIVSGRKGDFDPPVYFPVDPDRPASWIGVGDVNLDGHLDIVTSGNDIYFGHGNSTFDRSDFTGTGSGPRIADVTGDGVPDIVLAEFRAMRVLVGERNEANRPPTVVAHGETIGYEWIDDGAAVFAEGSDPDAHELTYEWRDADGRLVGTGSVATVVGDQPPGTYTFTVTACDGRGGCASADATVTIRPYKEINMHVGEQAALAGAWVQQADTTAADGIKLRHPNAGAAKLAAPLANPANFFELSFRADPTQTYKLWVRGKADGNSWANDSAFIQFTGATDTGGNPRWQIGSTDALPFNLEECSGCGVSGWGWEDDGWGAVNRNGTLLRFPEGGWQRIRVQTREDGLSIDQIVLSAETYVATRPGKAKNDTTILPATVVLED